MNPEAIFKMTWGVYFSPKIKNLYKLIVILRKGLKNRFLAFGMLYRHFYNTVKTRSILKSTKIDKIAMKCQNVDICQMRHEAICKMTWWVYFSLKIKNLYKLIVILRKGLKNRFFAFGVLYRHFYNTVETRSLLKSTKSIKLLWNAKMSIFVK